MEDYLAKYFNNSLIKEGEWYKATIYISRRHGEILIDSVSVKQTDHKITKIIKEVCGELDKK